MTGPGGPAGLEGFDATATYGAAAADDQAVAGRLWGFAGPLTVERLGLPPRRVGAGRGLRLRAATIPAAAAVGPSGRVVGVDAAEPMLALARAAAERAGLASVELRAGDMLDLDAGGERFDAVACVLGFFFAPDMVAALRGMRAMARPGGRLAVTVLGAGFPEPMFGVFREHVRAEGPEVEVRPPWTRTDAPGALEAIGPEAAARVRRADLAHARERGIDEVAVEVVCAVEEIS